ILSVAGLLADEHHFGPLQPFAEHRLRAAPPQVAGLASRGRFTKARERRAVRKQRCRGPVVRRGCHRTWYTPTARRASAGREKVSLQRAAPGALVSQGEA